MFNIAQSSEELWQFEIHMHHGVTGDPHGFKRVNLTYGLFCRVHRMTVTHMRESMKGKRASTACR